MWIHVPVVLPQREWSIGFQSSLHFIWQSLWGERYDLWRGLLCDIWISWWQHCLCFSNLEKWMSGSTFSTLYLNRTGGRKLWPGNYKSQKQYYISLSLFSERGPSIGNPLDCTVTTLNFTLMFSANQTITVKHLNCETTGVVILIYSNEGCAPKSYQSTIYSAMRCGMDVTGTWSWDCQIIWSKGSWDIKYCNR